MTKTPEEMAEEIENLAILDISLMVHNDSEWHAAKKAWFAGYKAAQPQWISVKDRLPEFLEVGSDGVQALLAFDQNTGNFSIPWILGRDKPAEGLVHAMTKSFTHWMPLPTPPKEEL